MEGNVSTSAANIDQEGSFLRQVGAAKKRVLLLDYDGTLAPFSPNRHRAFPYPGVPDLLRQIMTTCQTRLIVVSGRAAREVIPLLGLAPPPEIWGTHGLERLHPDGRYEHADVDPGTTDVLAQSEDKLEQTGLGPFIEVKIAAVAVHWRGLQPSESLKVRTTAFRILEPLAFQQGLQLAEFDEGAARVETPGPNCLLPRR